MKLVITEGQVVWVESHACYARNVTVADGIITFNAHFTEHPRNDIMRDTKFNGRRFQWYELDVDAGQEKPPEFLIRYVPTGIPGYVADDGKSPVFFMIVHLDGMFPGRVLANPFGGNCHYQTIEEAVRARTEIARKKAAGELI